MSRRDRNREAAKDRAEAPDAKREAAKGERGWPRPTDAERVEPPPTPMDKLRGRP